MSEFKREMPWCFSFFPIEGEGTTEACSPLWLPHPFFFLF